MEFLRADDQVHVGQTVELILADGNSGAAGVVIERANGSLLRVHRPSVEHRKLKRLRQHKGDVRSYRLLCIGRRIFRKRGDATERIHPALV